MGYCLEEALFFSERLGPEFDFELRLASRPVGADAPRAYRFRATVIWDERTFEIIEGDWIEPPATGPPALEHWAYQPPQVFGALV